MTCYWTNPFLSMRLKKITYPKLWGFPQSFWLQSWPLSPLRSRSLKFTTGESECVDEIPNQSYNGTIFFLPQLWNHKAFSPFVWKTLLKPSMATSLNHFCVNICCSDMRIIKCVAWIDLRLGAFKRCLFCQGWRLSQAQTKKHTE